MNGKVLKVKQYNLEFGTKDRFVNILGCFKYRPNGNVYVIYSDVDTEYNIIWYGSAHVKGDTILCMQCRDKSEEEIIKEYVFKLTKNDNMDNFEMILLDESNGIEIIASSKLEIKLEVFDQIIDRVLPEPEVKEEEVIVKESVQKKSSKTKFLKVLLVILIFVLVGVTACRFLFGTSDEDKIEKNIVCTKSYQHDELAADVDETNKYNFNIQDKLENVDTTMVYQFAEADYQEFIMKGTYYRYMPSSDIEGGWDKDDNQYMFKVMTKIRVDTSYNEPTNYEEVLSHYKAEGYTCTENIENE